MTYPSIFFVDASGHLFPLNEDGVPFVKQFKNRWYIKLDGPWSGGVALEASSPFPLSFISNSHLWEPTKVLSGDIVRRSGEITAVLTDLNGSVLKDSPKASLRIQPANITEQQMNKMIADIGIMALTTACCVKRSVPIPLGEGSGVESLGQQWAAGEGVLATATALLDLADIVTNSWSDLEKRPLKSFITEPGQVDIERANPSPQLIVQKLINPSKRRIFGIRRSESTLCSENEFLCHVLDYYLKDLADGLANSLSGLVLDDINDRFIPKNTKRDDQNFLDFLDKSRQKITIINSQNKALRQRVLIASEKLRECREWAIQARGLNFIRDIQTPQMPVLNSLRLTESPVYGPIYTKFVQVKGDALKPIQGILHLAENIFQGKVKPTWEIYEIWCFAKLYSGLIIYTGLMPKEDEINFFQNLSISGNGDIKLPKDKEFKLSLSLTDKTFLDVALCYEPKLENLDGQLRTPDILVKTTINGIQKSYLFDAKYRDYRQQGIDVLVEDVIGTARDKYRDGLTASGSFILHTDTKLDYWGEVPFDRFLDKELDADMNELEWPGHEYGAISLVPAQNEETQLKKIFRLLFQYHETQLSMACLSCGHKLAIGRDAYTSWKPDLISENELARRVLDSSDRAGDGTGIYCSCPKCGDFWVVQSCFGPHHRLLKFQDCFHKNSAHPEFKDKWMFICPECGSDPSLEELRQKRAMKVDIDNSW
jgi:hypothetical protein